MRFAFTIAEILPAASGMTPPSRITWAQCVYGRHGCMAAAPAAVAAIAGIGTANCQENGGTASRTISMSTVVLPNVRLAPRPHPGEE